MQCAAGASALGHRLAAEALKQAVDLVALLAAHPGKLQEHGAELPVVDVVRRMPIALLAVPDDLADFLQRVGNSGIIG